MHGVSKIFICFSVILITHFFHCSGSKYELKSLKGNEQKEESTIYGIVIEKIIEIMVRDHNVSKDAIEHGTLVFWDSTQVGIDDSTSNGIDNPENRFMSLERETLLSFFAKNQKKYALLMSDLDIDYNFTVISAETLRNPSNGATLFDELHTIFPEFLCLIRLSKVGFNKTNTQALAYFDYMLSRQNGGGFMVLLTKKNMQWQIVEFRMFWIA